MIERDRNRSDDFPKDPKKIQEELAEFEKELEDELGPIDEQAILGVRATSVPRDLQPPIEDHVAPIEDHVAPIEDHAAPTSPVVPPALEEAPQSEEVGAQHVEDPARGAVPLLEPDTPEATPPIEHVIEVAEALLEESLAATEPPRVGAQPRGRDLRHAVPLLPHEAPSIELLEEEPLEALPSPEEQEIDKTFHDLLDQYLPGVSGLEVGRIMRVPVVEVKADYVLVDVGDKAEGIIDINEFVDDEGEINLSVGDMVDVLLEERDEETGQIVVSHVLAEQKLSVERLRKTYEEKTAVRGVVSQVVKGGLVVKYGSVPCFLPASQVDIVRVEDLSQFLKREIEVYVLEFDLARNRIILSRRKLLQEKAEERRAKFLQSIVIGDLIAGRIKNVLDFGAFVDLGPLDGFIPREEVSWDRGVHPSHYLQEGRTAKYKIIALNRDGAKITLSRKQARANPWETIERRYPKGAVVRGVVSSLTGYGAFIRLEEGITGMIHVTDLSWAKGMKRPADYLKDGDNVKAVVLDIDKDKHRLSLGLKQITTDPWDEVEKKYPVGTRASGQVTYITKYGAFVRLDEDVEGMVHVSDLSWEKHAPKLSRIVKPGDQVDVVVLDLNREKRRMSLGIKQLSQSPFERFLAHHQVGSFVQGTVVSLTSFGAFVDLGDGVEGLIHISQLSSERINDPKEAVKVGERLECKISKLDTENEKISLSRKDYLREVERREVASYLSRNFKGGVNMGELLRTLDISGLPTDREP